MSDEPGLPVTGEAGWIDVHGHLAPLGVQAGGPPSLRDPEAVIAAKRELGIGMTIIGSPSGGGAMLPGTHETPSAGEVRAYNEKIGELVDAYSESLRAYVYVDPFGDDAMLAQAVELLADDRFVGIMTNSSLRGEYLGEPKAEAFFAMAEEAAVPVMVHAPASPVGCEAVSSIGLVEHGTRFCDVTVGIASVVCGGWLRRHPDLKLIAAGGGGGLAFLAEKLDLAMASGPPWARTDDDGHPPSESLRKIHVDTATASRQQFIANRAAFGPSNMLLGTDAPPLVSEIAKIVSIVREECSTVTELTRVGAGNAAELFGMNVEHV